jgi:hypothetical protein
VSLSSEIFFVSSGYVGAPRNIPNLYDKGYLMHTKRGTEMPTGGVEEMIGKVLTPWCRIFFEMLTVTKLVKQ